MSAGELREIEFLRQLPLGSRSEEYAEQWLTDERWARLNAEHEREGRGPASKKVWIVRLSKCSEEGWKEAEELVATEPIPVSAARAKMRNALNAVVDGNICSCEDCASARIAIRDATDMLSRHALKATLPRIVDKVWDNILYKNGAI